jgi:hypothetical protein
MRLCFDRDLDISLLCDMPDEEDRVGISPIKRFVTFKASE